MFFFCQGLDYLLGSSMAFRSCMYAICLFSENAGTGFSDPAQEGQAWTWPSHEPAVRQLSLRAWLVAVWVGKAVLRSQYMYWPYLE